MIRFATQNDINGIISLWHEAFGDTEDEIKFFLNNKFQPQNTLVIEENSAVVSMLFLLEGYMRIKGCDYPSYYLYAACTSKSCRGRGMMAMLLDFAAKTAKSRNFDFICLMPGEKSLFDFYSKHGYLPVFSKKILKVNRCDIDDSEFIAFSCNNADFNVETLRNNAFAASDYFKWNKNDILFAFEHTGLYGGQAFKCDKGYILYSIQNSDIHVKEFAFTADLLPCITQYLAKHHSFENIIFYLPAEYQTGIGHYQTVKSAMLLPVTDIAESLITDINNAYLGLTLD